MLKGLNYDCFTSIILPVSCQLLTLHSESRVPADIRTRKSHVHGVGSFFTHHYHLSGAK